MPAPDPYALLLALLALMPTKTCSRCGRALPVVMFNVATNAPDGLQAYCADCQATYARAYRERVTP